MENIQIILKSTFYILKAYALKSREKIKYRYFTGRNKPQSKSNITIQYCYRIIGKIDNSIARILFLPTVNCTVYKNIEGLYDQITPPIMYKRPKLSLVN
jgi:hypothetical protein